MVAVHLLIRPPSPRLDGFLLRLGRDEAVAARADEILPAGLDECLPRGKPVFPA